MLFMIKINGMILIYSVIHREMFLLVLCLISHLIYIIITMIDEKTSSTQKGKRGFL
ncbi:hypothetical protein Xvie_03020 [Xenorhabdus vietnamensis]|uniref:Uncharacterized protein n=1 Tax=Xenorhabdus vietnamensis TaxID=351656 RepID=A0A1Y2SAI7_9GAMM|nr:hypothetical protein Xvie_03020 [Xenorhabdus vietnamensis]